MKYRLVELVYADHSSWIIEMKVGLFGGWAELEEENIFFDYELALKKLKEYREKSKMPERIILDV